MEADRLADEPLYFILRLADHADAGEIGAVGAPRFALVLFVASPQELKAVYPKLPAFRRLRKRLDHGATFRNDFIARYVSGEAPDQFGM